MNSKSGTGPSVSVVINAHNGEAFIRDAIESALAQTYAEFELLVVDDASADGTREIVSSFSDDRIRLIHLEDPVSVADARTRAIEAARGEWIAFLDQDDLWVPEKLERQRELAARTPDCVMVYGRTMRFGEVREWAHFDPWYTGKNLPEGDIFRKVLARPSFIAMSSIMLRRDVALELLPMPDYIRHCPDYYLALEASRRGNVAAMQELCCQYRVHGASMSHVHETEIHAEAARIIKGAAGPEHAKILRRRLSVAASLVAQAEIRSGEFRGGLQRLMRDGSPAFLAGRPFLHVYRGLRERVQGSKMRYRILQTFRDHDMLGSWDSLSFRLKQMRAARSNRAFLKSNPDFRAPPADLAFDAYNDVCLEHYDGLGRRQAEGFGHFIREHAEHSADTEFRLLEWGCGPARLIRHMPELLADMNVSVFGSDYNPRTIDWCRENIAGVSFSLNGLNPPLEFPDDHFDACYNFSVFTHLSKEVQLAWAAELRRVLKPGGILLTTTHGQNFEHLVVSPDDRSEHARGNVVVQAGYEEGKKWYFALHPESFVRNQLLAGFCDVRKLDAAPWGITQDLWLARKGAS